MPRVKLVQTYPPRGYMWVRAYSGREAWDLSPNEAREFAKDLTDKADEAERLNNAEDARRREEKSNP